MNADPSLGDQVILNNFGYYPAGNYILKVNNRKVNAYWVGTKAYLEVCQTSVVGFLRIKAVNYFRKNAAS